MAEFPNIGSQCALQACSQLDFLPFECELCRKTFCLEHRFPVAHDCPNMPPLSSCQYDGPTGTIQSYECSLSSCNGRELMLVVCPQCSNNFCLKHRHPPDHECTCGTKVVKDSSKHNLSAKTVKVPTCRGRKSQRTSLQVALMKLKMKAKGLDSIPTADRVYFEIQVAVEKDLSQSSSASGYFFSKEWTVGRSLDYVAAQEKLSNLNNVIGHKKLRLFTLGELFLLPTDSTWSSLMENATTENGSTLVLQYFNNEL